MAARPKEPLAVACLEHGDQRIVLGPVDAMGTTDLALVDDLLRLQLLTRRLGWRLRLSEVCDELRELLELVGLADQLEDGPASGQSSR